jgi:hypothetical protein
MPTRNSFSNTVPNPKALRAYVTTLRFVASSVLAADDDLMDEATENLFKAHGIPCDGESWALWAVIIEGWDAQQWDGETRLWFSPWPEALTAAGFGGS